MKLDGLTTVCAASRTVMGAAAVSVAVIDNEVLRYVAADGAGAREIIGTVLSDGRGLASYVAVSAQALVIGSVSSDLRFARDVAEGTGYVPSAMLLVPILAADGEVGGVLSVLDRAASTLGDSDALAVAGRFADVATHFLDPDIEPAPSELTRRIMNLDEGALRAIHALLDAFGA